MSFLAANKHFSTIFRRFAIEYKQFVLAMTSDITICKNHQKSQFEGLQKNSWKISKSLTPVKNTFFKSCKRLECLNMLKQVSGTTVGCHEYRKIDHFALSGQDRPPCWGAPKNTNYGAGQSKTVVSYSLSHKKLVTAIFDPFAHSYRYFKVLQRPLRSRFWHLEKGQNAPRGGVHETLGWWQKVIWPCFSALNSCNICGDHFDSCFEWCVQRYYTFQRPPKTRFFSSF